MKKELKFYICMFLTIIFLVFIFFIISKKTDVLDLETIDSLFYNNWNFLAEKNEKTMYIVGLILAPSFFFLMYLLFNKFKLNNKLLEHYFSNIFISLIFFFFFYYYGFVENGYANCLKNIFKTSGIISLVFLLIFPASYLIYKKIIKSDNKLINEIINKLLIVICLFCLSLVAIIFIKTNFFFTYHASMHHFEAFYYPAYYVYHNLNIGIDFTNIYGLYPYFLLPVFKLLGGISILNFTTIYAIIIVFVSILLLIFLFKYLKNKYVAFLAFLSLLMYYLQHLVIFRAGFYYQYLPHRIMFPIMIFFIIYRILTSSGRKQSIYIILGYIVSGMSVFYNIDSGVVTVITYLGFNLYQNALDYNFKDKKMYIQSLKNLGYTMISCFSFFLLFKLIIFLRSGSNVKLINIFYGQTVFYKLGFNMLKMGLNHPWIILIFSYFYYLIYSITKFKCFNIELSSENRIKYSLLFSLSLIGLGIFSYYQGRSHDEVFSHVIWPIIIIAAITLDDIHINPNNYYKYNYYLKEILIITFFTIFSFIFSYSLMNNDEIKSFLKINHTEYNSIYDVDLVKKEYEILKKEYLKVNLILDYTANFYSYLNITDFPKLDNQIDWLYNKEKIDTTLSYILDHDNEAFLISRLSYNYLVSNAEMMKKIEKSFDFKGFSVINTRNNNYQLVDEIYRNFIILTPLENE